MIRIFKSSVLRTAVITLGVVIAFRAISEWTGSGDWLDATPVATATVRIVAILFLSGIGVLALLGGRWDPEMRRWGYRLTGIVFLLLAAINATLLINGEATFSNFLPE